MSNTVNETIVRYFVISPQDIVFLKAVLESYEGMVVVRTVEIGKPVIECLIAHAFQQEINLVLQDLAGQINLQEIPSPEAYSPSPP